MPRAGRVVYSTDRGRLCPKCGWPADDCRCAKSLAEAVPEKLAAVLRLEKAGRGGKAVTVIDGLPRNAKFLDELARDLKRGLGTGGAVREGAIEIQGDRRAALRTKLQAQGWRVKG